MAQPYRNFVVGFSTNGNNVVVVRMTRGDEPLNSRQFRVEFFCDNGLDAVTGMLNCFLHGSSDTFGYVPLKVSNKALTVLKFLGQGLTSNVYELNGGYALKTVKKIYVRPGNMDVLSIFSDEYIILERIRRALEHVDTVVAGDLSRHTILLANEFDPQDLHDRILVTYPAGKRAFFLYYPI